MKTKTIFYVTGALFMLGLTQSASACSMFDPNPEGCAIACREEGLIPPSWCGWASKRPAVSESLLRPSALKTASRRER